MMQLNNSSEWFATWFNSPYYHILYKSRDDKEAKAFIERLCASMDIPKENQLLDLACGAGRHARVMHELGYHVSGCDLSENSIREAATCAPDDMHFFVHDMRNPLPEKYDVIFNLFTSIGYFSNTEENLQVFQSVHQALNPEGRFVIDFMNCTKVIRELKLRQELTIEGILFHIKKEVMNGKIVKTIAFQDKGESFFFQEKVQTLFYDDFCTLLEKAGFTIAQTFGSYALEPFDEDQSDRLILICTQQ